MPGAFALPAGTGDIVVRLLALPAALLLRAGAAGSRSLATVPRPLQVIVPDVPNATLGTFLTVMILAFAVPSSILLHVLDRLERRAKRQAFGR